jgi:adenylate cyclase, class 2
MTDYLELEVKLYVPDLETVSQRLAALGAGLAVPRVFERNVRYEDSQHSLTERGIVVRLRQDNAVRLTYKEPPTGTSDELARFEAEVSVSDFDTMHLILQRLGYYPYLIYEKYRTTYHFMGTEIVLDEMPYGSFVEIEGDDRDAIHRVMETLGLDAAPRYDRNYVSLFNSVKDALGLDFHDLTFDNFAGIDVSPSAFGDPA